MLADCGIGVRGVLSQVRQFGIGTAVNPIRVRKSVGEIRLGEAEEFFLFKLSCAFGRSSACPKTRLLAQKLRHLPWLLGKAGGGLQY